MALYEVIISPKALSWLDAYILLNSTFSTAFRRVDFHSAFGYNMTRKTSLVCLVIFGGDNDDAG